MLPRGGGDELPSPELFGPFGDVSSTTFSNANERRERIPPLPPRDKLLERPSDRGGKAHFLFQRDPFERKYQALISENRGPFHMYYYICMYVA